MSQLNRNILANYLGQGWMALIGLAFVPLYIKFLGIEAYGLMGVFATLQALFALLDLGLGHTINRELARLSGGENTAAEMRDLARTLEIPYWMLGMSIGAIVVFLSPLIAHRWVNVETLSPDTVQRAVFLMGICIGLRWPSGLYGGGLLGLQRQVLFNGINIVVETCRAVGAVLILWAVSSTLEAFFVWQALFSFASTLMLGMFMWHSLPASSSGPRFRKDLLARIWRFAAGITGISLLSTILMQLDKVILSRMLSLETFGFYALASVVALTLYRIFGPVFTAIYPRFTNLIAKESSAELISVYHRSAQLLAVTVLPAAAIVTVFSKEVMLIWTQDPNIAEQTWKLVSILTIGTALNGVMHIPYGLQLAAGWTRLTFMLNLASVLLLAPLMLLLTYLYGAVGAASVWVILNTAYVIFGIQIMHRRLLKSEKWRWYGVDVGLPLATSFLLASLLRWTMPSSLDMIGIVIYVAASSCVTLAAAALATPFARNLICTRLSMFTAPDLPKP